MQKFLRQYQRFFYLVITVVIIISFSFFGTYSTLGKDPYREQIAFTAVDGTAVSRRELEQLVFFIGTDARDKLILGGMWGPNFLNDGVVTKNFFETGLAQQLFQAYSPNLSVDLEKKFEREKRFVSYTHPTLPILSAEAIWSSLAPNLRQQLHLLQANQNGASPETFAAKVQLYLAERQFPAAALQHFLYQQERQYGLEPDPQLRYSDFSLFGYHTLDDWFGPRWLRLVGEFIINSAKIAEERGYRVSKEEALADLMRNAEISYQENAKNPHIGVANSEEYFQEQLQRLSLDRNQAAQVWRQVLLFRRLFQDAGQSVFVDPQAFVAFDTYAKATVEGELYQLPPELRFNRFQTLRLFETYLHNVTAPSTNTNPLILPNTFLSATEVLERAPELVQKRYMLDLSEIKSPILQAKIGIKETWNWEVEDGNWQKIQDKFPDLNAKAASTREERFAFLDRLDESTRAQVDTFARQAIVEARPEWIDKALQEEEPKRVSLSLNYKGGRSPFAGLKNSTHLMKLLDAAPLGEQYSPLATYSADKNSYYKIVVIDRSTKPEVVTFAEALQNGILEPLIAQANLDEKKLSEAIYEAYAKGIAPQKAPSQLIEDVSASLRFYAHMQEIMRQLKKNPKSSESWVRSSPRESDADHLLVRSPLSEQWKLIQTAYSKERGSPTETVHLSLLFSLAPGSWSPIFTPVTGDLSFFKLEKKGNASTTTTVAQRVNAARELLSDETEQQLMLQLLEEMKTKNALSLNFMDIKEESIEEPL